MSEHEQLGRKMVFSFIDESEKIIATIQNKDITTRYECNLRSCDNPVCRCGIVYLNLHSIEQGSEENEISKNISSYQVDIDIIERKLGYKDKNIVSKENLDFANILISKMDDADFTLLWKVYFGYKNKKTEEATIDSIDAVFDYQEVEEDGLMYAYNDVLPYGDHLYFEINGKDFLIFDQYCLLPKCSCTDTTLSIYPAKQYNRGLEELFSVELTYKNKKWKKPKARTTSPDIQSVRSALEEQIPDFYKKLLNRHKKIKGIYANCKKKHFADMQQVREVKIGRNAPCPCGSGKKYKKCCMGKSN
jgi:hypothetical protein